MSMSLRNDSSIGGGNFNVNLPGDHEQNKKHISQQNIQTNNERQGIKTTAFDGNFVNNIF